MKILNVLLLKTYFSVTLEEEKIMSNLYFLL